MVEQATDICQHCKGKIWSKSILWEDSKVNKDQNTISTLALTIQDGEIILTSAIRGINNSSAIQLGSTNQGNNNYIRLVYHFLTIKVLLLKILLVLWLLILCNFNKKQELASRVWKHKWANWLVLLVGWKYKDLESFHLNPLTIQERVHVL